MAWLRELWRRCERAVDVLLWLHHGLMLYLLLVWFIPIAVLAGLSLCLPSPGKVSQTSAAQVLLNLLWGLPAWYGLFICAERGTGKWAERLRRFWDGAPVVIESGILVVAVGLLIAGKI